MSTPWHIIEKRLIDDAVIVGGDTRRARARVCSCGAKILTGFDADVCAILAKVDPTPLSALGEALAQLDGRRTYALCPDRGRLVLDERTSGRISYRPAGTGRFDVMPQHKCGTATATWPQIPSFTADRHAALLPAGSPPPF